MDIKNLIASAVPANPVGYNLDRYLDAAAGNVDEAVTAAANQVVEEAQRRFGYGEQAKALLVDAGLLPQPTVTVSIEVQERDLSTLTQAVAEAQIVLARATEALRSAGR